MNSPIAGDNPVVSYLTYSPASIEPSIIESIQLSITSITAMRAIKPINIAPTLTANFKPSVIPFEAASIAFEPTSILGRPTSPDVADFSFSGKYPFFLKIMKF